MTIANDAGERRSRSRRAFRTKWVVFGLVALCLAGCLVLLPCVQKVRDGEGWVQSAVSLRQIGRAVHDYHEPNGQLPPAAVTDREGRPLYSWRVLLLPYLEEDHLYRQFHLDEPWDSPHNKQLLGRRPGATARLWGASTHPV